MSWYNQPSPHRRSLWIVSDIHARQKATTQAYVVTSLRKGLDMHTENSAQQWELKKRLEELLPTLGPLYGKCLELLDAYDRDSPDARATLAFLAHGVRETLNAIPDVLGTTVITTQSAERKALESLKAALRGTDNTFTQSHESQNVSIPLDIARALSEYQLALTAGSQTASARMASVFLGDSRTCGGALVPVQKAQKFFMQYVHIDRTDSSPLPTKESVCTEFFLLETSIRARIDDFFAAKNRMREFLDSVNTKKDDGSYPKPSNNDIQKGLALSADPNLAHVFFFELENPLWLRELSKRRALTNLATPETTGSWREYAYVKRMASVVPEDVCDALKTAGVESPPLVRSAVLYCAAHMPPKNAVSLIRIMMQWVGDDATLEDYCWLTEDLSRLFNKTLSCTQTKKVTNQFMQGLYRPRPSRTHLQGQPYYGSFTSCIPSYCYEESLGDALQCMPAINRVAVLRSYFKEIQGIRALADNPLTSYFVPSVDDVCQDNSQEIEQQLVRLMCKSLHDVVVVDKNRFGGYALDTNNHMLQRCAISVLDHVMREADSSDIDSYLELAKKVFAMRNVLDGDYDPELFPLVRSTLDRNPSLPLSELLSGLDIGLHMRHERWRERLSQSEDIDASMAEVMAWKKARKWQHRILSLIGKGYLTGSYLVLFNELEAEFGTIEYSERLVSKTEWSWGNDSPISYNEMSGMSPVDLLEYLRTCSFPKADQVLGGSHRGQSDVLRDLVSRNPYHFSGCISSIEELRPTYVSAIVSGWSTALENREDVPLNDLLAVCSWTARIPEDLPFPSEGGPFDDDDSYDPARTGTAHLLDAILRYKTPEELESTSEEILDSLVLLCKSKHQDEPDDRRYGQGSLDPVTQAMNTTRSIALSALGRWSCLFNASHRAPEALEVFGNSMPSQTEALCDAAAIGLAMPHIIQTHEEWAFAHRMELLGGPNATPSQQVVLTTMLGMFPFRRWLFDYVRPALVNALESNCEAYLLGHDGTHDCCELIGIWSMQALLLGHITLTDDIYSLWEKKSDPARQCAVLRYCCSSICDLKLGANLRTALLFRSAVLWDRLFKRSASSTLPIEAAHHLHCSIRKMIKTGFYPSSWWAPRLAALCKTSPQKEDLAFLQEELTDLAGGDPEAALDILDAAASQSAGNMPLYALRRVAVPIISAAFKQEDERIHGHARGTMSKLGRLGLVDLDTLIESAGQADSDHPAT